MVDRPSELPAWLSAVLVRDLRALEREVLAYDNEHDLWETPGGVTNSAGTLALHVAGNLRHFIGATLGGSGYVRDREAEFSVRGVPREEIVSTLRLAAEEVRATLEALPGDRLAEPFPPVFGSLRLTTGDALLHLTTHLAYHLGQIDTHRRIVTGNAEGVQAVSLTELSSAS